MALLPRSGALAQTDQLILHFTEVGGLNNKEPQLTGRPVFLDTGSLPGLT